jgi:hypothetical protein
MNGIRLALVIVHPGRNLRFGAEAMPMTFMIELLVGEGNAVVLHVCGRMDSESVHTLKELIEAENSNAVLDLSEVTLADREAATFLAVCALEGIELRNCPSFLHEWVAKEQAALMP